VHWTEIASAICIYLSATIFCVAMFKKNKQNLLFVQLFASALYLSSLLFVIALNPNSFIGVLTSVCEFIRAVCFYFLERSEIYNTKKNNLLLAIGFCLLMCVCTIFSWQSAISLLPFISAILVSFALGIKNFLLLKITYLTQSIFMTVYFFLLNLPLNAYSQMLIAFFGLFSLLIASKRR